MLAVFFQDCVQPIVVFDHPGNDRKFLGFRPHKGSYLLLALDILVVLGLVAASLLSNRLGISVKGRYMIQGAAIAYGVSLSRPAKELIMIFLNHNRVYDPNFRFKSKEVYLSESK